MKKIIAVSLMLFGLSGISFAGEFGPPSPLGKGGQTSIGVGYNYYSSKWGADNQDWADLEVKQNQAYIQASYAVTNDWEGYLRAGGADIKMDNELGFDSPQNFKDSFKAFGTVGFRGLFYNTPSFGIGPFFQANFYSSYEDQGYGTIGGIPASVKLKFSRPWDINAGIGFQTEIGGALLYAGPFYYLARAKEEQQTTALGTTDTISSGYEEHYNLGGFLGVRVPIGCGFTFNVEGQYKSRGSVGLSLSKSF